MYYSCSNWCWCSTNWYHPGGAGPAGGRLLPSFTQGYFRDQKGSGHVRHPSPGEPGTADLFDQARRFYTRGEHRTVPVSLTAQVQGRCPWFSPPGTRQTHTAVVQGPCPQAARTRQTTVDQVAGQLRRDRGHRLPGAPGPGGPGPRPVGPPVGGEQPAPPEPWRNWTGPAPSPLPGGPFPLFRSPRREGGRVRRRLPCPSAGGSS